MNKLQVRENQPNFGSPVDVIDCPMHMIELSDSHCHRKLCDSYKGRVENLDKGEHFVVCGYRPPTAAEVFKA